MSRVKGKGWFVNEHDVIYVQGNINGKFTRKTTGKKATALNLAWIKKNANQVLLQLNVKQEEAKKVENQPFMSDFCNEVLELTANKRSKKAQDDYKSKIKNYIEPYFKNFRLNDVLPMSIESFQNKLLEKLSSSTVHKCRVIINITFKKAYANRLIEHNPALSADPVEVTNEKRQSYSIEEAQELLQKADGWLKIFLLLAFTTGMRTGELMALKWEDINLEEGYIFVQRTISDEDEEVTRVSENKNHNRVVELVKDAIYALASYHMNRPDDEWLFVSKYGTPFKKSRHIIDSHFKPLLMKTCIAYKTLYATRHTFTSMMINGGFDRTWVKQQLGHSANSNVMEKHYFNYERNNTRLEAVNNFFNYNIIQERKNG
jgi:integrase